MVAPPPRIALQVHLATSLNAIAPAEWNALVGADHPFVEHAFLLGLELAGCVGPETAWQPLYLIARSDSDGGQSAGTALPAVLGAVPLYGKSDSFGEFIFDFSWAQAAHQLGVRYYPKLVAAAPFTPATGPRLLLHPLADQTEVATALAQAVLQLARANGLSSAHWLHLPLQQAEFLVTQGFQHRTTVQAQWHNAGYEDFEAFLATRRSPIRKQIRRERRQVAQQGLEISVESGSELGPADWRSLYRLYANHCQAYNNNAWLNEDFFEHLRQHMPERMVASVARRDGQIVAATVNFTKGSVLYGRYWGSDVDLPFLHFEMAFYRLIEHCIAQGIQRFEAGSGGDHKLQRGLEAVPIHSAHWLADPRLAHAVAQANLRERAAVDQQVEWLRLHGSARRDGETRAEPTEG